MFEQPHEVDDVMLAFPSGLRNLMPAYDDIPDDFKKQSNPWVQFQQRWFFDGLKEIPKARDGIDLKKALRHLKAIQGSFEPKHEHKEAAVAYLASKWLVAP